MTTINYKGRQIHLTEPMLEALQYALKYPKRWHTIAQDASSRAAVERLEAEGLVEVRDYSNQFCVTP